MSKIINNAILYIGQFIQTIPMHKEGYDFIKKHQPWKGMERYSWTARVLLISAILLGFFLFKDAFYLIKDIFSNEENTQLSLGSFFTDFSFDKIDWALHGTKKYVILIVLEIFTFHFIQRTLELQMGRKPTFTLKAFIAAEKRMIEASFIAWIMEVITIAIAKMLVGLVGLGYLLNDPIGLVIQFYFLGFIIIDNYHECFGLTLKESRKRTNQVAGVAIAIGGVAYLLMFVPLIGVVAATMIGAVTATLAMQRILPLEEKVEFV